MAAVGEATRPGDGSGTYPAVAPFGTLLEGAGYLCLLRRHGVPILYGRAITRVEGEGRAERALISRLSADWAPLADRTQWIDVDLICTGFGFVPSLELARQVGCATLFDPAQQTAVVTRDDRMRSNVPGV